MKYRTKKKLKDYLLRYLIIAVALLLTLVPLYVTVVTSLTPADKVGSAFILPRYFEWRNYVKLFEVLPMASYIKSSLIYAFGCSILSVVIASLSSYCLLYTSTVAAGAVCVLGGKRFNRNYFEPTILDQVTREMDIARNQEVFGPVFPVIAFDTAEEAIEIANQSHYGLSGGIMCGDCLLYTSRCV